jgi:hypothetical protein
MLARRSWLLLVWRILSQWKDKSEQAGNLRTAALIMGVVAAVMLGWLLPRRKDVLYRPLPMSALGQ